MLARGFADRTRESYLDAVIRLARFYHRAPDQISDEEVQAYLVHLIRDRQLSWSTCNIVVNGLRFFYHTTLKRDRTTFTIPSPRRSGKLLEVLRAYWKVEHPTEWLFPARGQEPARPMDRSSLQRPIRAPNVGRPSRNRVAFILCGTRRIACRPGFFLPVRVLSRLFRRLFLEQLEAAFTAGTLHLAGSLHALRDPHTWARYLAPVRQVDWVVYAKRPFAGPQQVLDYVGRYTHRVAIANDRIRDIDHDEVRFTYKDYRADPAQSLKTMTLAAAEFIRRFL